MPAIEITGPYNFQTLVADFDDTGPGDITFDDFGTTTFNMDNGLTASMTVLELFGEFFSLVTISDANGQIASFGVEANLSFTNGVELSTALQSFPSITYSSTSPGAEIGGFVGTADLMSGLGDFRGFGGSDTIGLIDTLGLDDGTRHRAFGNNGDDALYAAVERSLLNGGNGDDTLEVGTGSARLIGGNGADEFYFDSGVFNGATGTGRINALISDFDNFDDSVFFNQDNGSLPAGGEPETTSIGDLFESSTLTVGETLDFDGVRYFFREASDGDALIQRRGTDSEGNVYRENVRFDGVGLDELDAYQLFILEYNATPDIA